MTVDQWPGAVRAFPSQQQGFFINVMILRRGSGISIPATGTGNIFQPSEPPIKLPPQDQVDYPTICNHVLRWRVNIGICRILTTAIYTILFPLYNFRRRRSIKLTGEHWNVPVPWPPLLCLSLPAAWPSPYEPSAISYHAVGHQPYPTIIHAEATTIYFDVFSLVPH